MAATLMSKQPSLPRDGLIQVWFMEIPRDRTTCRHQGGFYELRRISRAFDHMSACTNGAKLCTSWQNATKIDP